VVHLRDGVSHEAFRLAGHRDRLRAFEVAVVVVDGLLLGLLLGLRLDLLFLGLLAAAEQPPEEAALLSTREEKT
jgi:hypothetical protein